MYSICQVNFWDVFISVNVKSINPMGFFKTKLTTFTKSLRCFTGGQIKDEIEMWFKYFQLSLLPTIVHYRSSPGEVLFANVVLKICSKFTGEHPNWSAISIELLCIRNFITTDLQDENVGGIINWYKLHVTFYIR